MFIFAKALPIHNIIDKNMIMSDYVFQNNIQDDIHALINKLSNCSRNAELNFTVLTEKFLQTLSTNGTHVLHLTPCMLNIYDNSRNMIIEGDNLNMVKITP